MTNEIPIIGKKKKEEVHLEAPITFAVTLWFTNHTGEMTKMEFNLPGGVYPNARWLEKLIKQASRGALKSLKMSTKDLSWRIPTPAEFFKVTAGPQAKDYMPKAKWQEPYSNPMDVEVPDVEKPEETNGNN